MDIFQTLSTRRRLWMGAALAVLLLAAVAVVVWRFALPLLVEEDDPLAAAQQHLQASEYDSAIATLEAALANDPDDVALLAQLVQAYALKGTATGTEREAYELAQPHAARLLELAPEDADALAKVGYLAETAGYYREASKYYMKASVLVPQDAQMLFRFAHTLEFIDFPAEDIDALYYRAYELDPTNPQVLLALGNRTLLSVSSEDDLERAYAFFLAAAEQSDQKALRAEGWAAAAQVRLRQGYYEEAISLAAAAVNEDRSYAPGLAIYGEAIAHDGQLNAGLDYVAEAIDRNPRRSASYQTAGALLRVGGEYEKAIEYMEEGIERLSDDNTLVGESARTRAHAQLLYDLAKTHDMAGNTDEASFILDEAIAVDPIMEEYARLDAQEHGFFSEIFAE